MEDAPNCYNCSHRGTIAGDCHSSCANKEAKVKGKEFGVRKGWFYWPYNFDPLWLISCDGFKQKEEEENPLCST